MIHWVQDFARVSKTPNINNLDEASFSDALGVAAQSSTTQKQEAKDASSVSSKASPGKLKDYRKWNEWITRFENMLLYILGVNGVPLLYVVRENPELMLEGQDTFVQKSVACDPLTGPHFEANARRVHQFVTSFTQGNISEKWIKMNARKQNSNIDLEALHAY